MVMIFLYNTSLTTGSKYLEYNPGSELNFCLLNNEQWKAKGIKWKQKSNKECMEKSNNEKITNNNDKYTWFNWHMNTMHNINKLRVSIEKVEMWLSRHCTGLKNILVITELIITTLFDRVLMVRYHMLPRVPVLPKKVVHKNPSVTQIAHF
jgi:hypothetical protein